MIQVCMQYNASYYQKMYVFYKHVRLQARRICTFSIKAIQHHNLLR